ncbi:MAG: hydrogenase formation protein HypD [Polyangia bacterium]|jgi:hydrogenase expression/formation protein HypD
MKFVDEYRDQAQAEQLAQAILRATTRPWSIMEVCGGQTHSIVKYGIDELLPPQITLLHGPGCPVCVTPLEMVDKALQIALAPQVIFCSFGDMLRVPGSHGDLFSVKAKGADVRIVYSPLDALRLARDNPQREVVFFAVGFETTAPANAMAVFQAHAQGIGNFSVLVSHVLVPPAMAALLSAPDNRTQAFLAAGHVCTVMGFHQYFALAEKFRVPIVVTGFEPLDILQGILMCVTQLESGRAEVANQYVRSVKPQGNRAAQDLMAQVFRVVNRKWRGIGEIALSGYGLAAEFSGYDAELRFGVAGYQREEDAECISGQILRGVKKPQECPAFARRCTPEHPLGATMVSDEGACAAYYRYRRRGPVRAPQSERGA